MGGILNINKFLIIIITFSFGSCKRNYVPQDFIENNFLTIVDTTAYQYGSFRPLPPLPNKRTEDKILYTNFAVNLIDSIGYNERVQQYVDSFFDEHIDLKIAFQDALIDTQYSRVMINEKFSKRIGRYCIFFNRRFENKSSKYVGEIKFQNFKIGKEKAFFVINKSEGHSTIVFIELFEKQKGSWQLVRKEVLFES